MTATTVQDDPRIILDRRIGEYELPEGSVVIGAGNRTTDNALAKPMASALVNRLVHIHLRASAGDWLHWAGTAGIHPWVLDYLRNRPDHLWTAPPKTEEPFSTPRSWHMLSDALHSYGDDVADETLRVLAFGTLTAAHASAFRAYVKTVRNAFGLDAVLKGETGWPAAPEDRDLLYFLAETRERGEPGEKLACGRRIDLVRDRPWPRCSARPGWQATVDQITWY